jgi:hypothetical protein
VAGLNLTIRELLLLSFLKCGIFFSIEVGTLNSVIWWALDFGPTRVRIPLTTWFFSKLDQSHAKASLVAQL